MDQSEGEKISPKKQRTQKTRNILEQPPSKNSKNGSLGAKMSGWPKTGCVVPVFLTTSHLQDR